MCVLSEMERIASGWGSRFFGLVPHDRLDFADGGVHYEFPVPSFAAAPDAPTFASYCCAVADIACTTAVKTVVGESVAAITQGLWVHFEAIPSGVQRVSATAQVQPVAGARLLVEGYIRADGGDTIARILANCLGVTVAAADWADPMTDRSDPPTRATDMAPLGLKLEPSVDGRVSGVLPAATELSNGVKMLHGGAATLVAEAVSRAVLDRGARWTLADLDARFIRPIRADGQVITCRATLRHSGKSSATVAWKIFDDTGHIGVYGSTAWIRDRSGG
jgi:uncharacterized protein (TIGR00369 family)